MADDFKTGTTKEEVAAGESFAKSVYPWHWINLNDDQRVAMLQDAAIPRVLKRAIHQHILKRWENQLRWDHSSPEATAYRDFLLRQVSPENRIING